MSSTTTTGTTSPGLATARCHFHRIGDGEYRCACVPSGTSGDAMAATNSRRISVPGCSGSILPAKVIDRGFACGGNTICGRMESSGSRSADLRSRFCGSGDIDSGLWEILQVGGEPVWLDYVVVSNQRLVKFLGPADAYRSTKPIPLEHQIIMQLGLVVREGTHAFGPFTESSWAAFRIFLSVC